MEKEATETDCRSKKKLSHLINSGVITFQTGNIHLYDIPQIIEFLYTAAVDWIVQ